MFDSFAPFIDYIFFLSSILLSDSVVSSHFPLDTSDATRHSTVVLVVVARAWVDVATEEIQEVRGAAIARRGGPIESARTTTAHRRTIHVAGRNKVIRIGAEGVRN